MSSNKAITMAKPIESTPVLEGKNALDLINDLRDASCSESKRKFFNSCLETYKSISLK